jgi:hypothetical protein
MIRRERPGMDPAMVTLRKNAPANELDYGFIMHHLRSYQSPRSKLTQLIKCGALVRLKREFYVFGSLFIRGHYCLETLANQLYGPSYVSLEWALQVYGMIPENVEEITSITFKQKKKFDTPLGRFSYEHRPRMAYPVGITRLVVSEYQSALIATPEKAIIDLLVLRRGKVTSVKELKEILFEDFRFVESDMSQLNLDLIRRIQNAHPHSSTMNLIKLLEMESYL